MSHNYGCNCIIHLLFLLKVLLLVEPQQCESNSKVGWHCSGRTGGDYCVHTNSMCLTWHGILIILTDDEELHGKKASLRPSNAVAVFPLHLPDINNFHELDGVPDRTFFNDVMYQKSKPKDAVVLDGLSFIASFEIEDYNFYHWVNIIHVGFLARYYERFGLETSGRQNKKSMIQSLLQRNSTSQYKRALLGRSPGTKWQQGYADIALGEQTQYIYKDEINKLLMKYKYICFDKVVVPGASLYLGDSVESGLVFREMAAALKGIRVPKEDRNAITIVLQEKRRIINYKEVIKIIQEEQATLREAQDNSISFRIHIADFTSEDSFEVQALLMARTRILITTHGMVQAHATMMESGGSVYELNGFGFNYPLFETTSLFRGLYYFRDEMLINQTILAGATKLGDDIVKLKFGKNPYAFAKSEEERYKIFSFIVSRRRDAHLIVDPFVFRKRIRQILSIYI